MADDTVPENAHEPPPAATPSGPFGYIAKFIPYFRDPSHVLIFKLDIMLLLWMFVAGVRCPFPHKAAS